MRRFHGMKAPHFFAPAKIYTGMGYSGPDGYGKVEKPECAFQLSHNHGDDCWNFCFENRMGSGPNPEHSSGAKARSSFRVYRHG